MCVSLGGFKCQSAYYTTIRLFYIQLKILMSTGSKHKIKEELYSVKDIIDIQDRGNEFGYAEGKEYCLVWWEGYPKA